MKLPKKHLDNLTHITLDCNQTETVISPLLFGYNVEITRRGVWQGLSAEMVANRKFAAAENGKPKRWMALGDGGCAVIDDSTGYAGKQSVKIEIRKEGTYCGIAQEEKALFFEKEKEYAVRLSLQSDASRIVRICLIETAKGQTLFEKEWFVTSGEWQVFSENLYLQSQVKQIAWKSVAVKLVNSGSAPFLFKMRIPFTVCGAMLSNY